MNSMDDISRLTSGLTLARAGVQNPTTSRNNPIAQERGNEAISEQSGQSPHISLGHGLEGVVNGDAVDKICNGIVKVFGALGRILGAIFKGIGKLAEGVLEGVLDLIKKLTEKIKEIANCVQSDVAPTAVNVAQAIREGANAAGQVVGAIHGAPITAALGGIVTLLPDLTDGHL
jgi:hypothetical protein